MAKWFRFLSSLVCAGSLSLFARPAAADEPATAGALQWGVGFRYGFELEEGDIVNPWGVGLGAELGYTLPVGAYVGGNFDYFFGEEEEVLGASASANLWQIMAEGGYDVGVGPNFVIRPKLGLGFATTSFEACFDGICADDSSTDFALAPGAKFMFLSESFGLSADLRYEMIFAENETGNGLILSIGVGF